MRRLISFQTARSKIKVIIVKFPSHYFGSFRFRINGLVLHLAFWNLGQLKYWLQIRFIWVFLVLWLVKKNPCTQDYKDLIKSISSSQLRHILEHFMLIKQRMPKTTADHNKKDDLSLSPADKDRDFSWGQGSGKIILDRVVIWHKNIMHKLCSIGFLTEDWILHSEMYDRKPSICNRLFSHCSKLGWTSPKVIASQIQHLFPWSRDHILSAWQPAQIHSRWSHPAVM